MPKYISIYGSKGGIGKSTITSNLAAGLSKYDKKVLIVSADGQNNSLRNLNKEIEYDYNKTLNKLFAEDRTTVEDIVIKVRDNIDGIVTYKPKYLEAALSQYMDRLDSIGNFMFPPKEMEKYDYVFFDLGPVDTFFGSIALKMSDAIFMILNAEFEGVESIEVTRRTFLEDGISEDKIKAVIVNMLQTAKISNKLALQTVKTIFKDIPVFSIPMRARISNANANGESLFDSSSCESVIIDPLVELEKIIARL